MSFGADSPGRRPRGSMHAPLLPTDSEQAAAAFSRAWMLRAASVVPFVVLGMSSLIAAVSSLVIAVFGRAGLPSIVHWRLAGSAGQKAGVVALLVLTVLVPAGLVAVSVRAALRGMRPRAGRWFWWSTAAVATAFGVALMVAPLASATVDRELRAAGVGPLEVVLLVCICGYTVVMALVRLRHEARAGDPEGTGEEARGR
jgi:hypothetical protein